MATKKDKPPARPTLGESVYGLRMTAPHVRDPEARAALVHLLNIIENDAAARAAGDDHAAKLADEPEPTEEAE